MLATRVDAPGTPAAPAAAWRSAVFGIDVEGDFEAPGLPPAVAPPAGPRARVEIVAPAQIDARWRPYGAERLLEERFDDDAQAARSIERLPGVGYRLYARHFGLALVADDGTRVLCAPPQDEPWSWQRFLVGRILPWTAVLLGREVFHAGAVAIGGHAFGLIGASGAGKSSLVAHLLLGGAGFVTDDVLALEQRDGVLHAHPGAAILCMRHAERAAIRSAAFARLGRTLGDSGKLYVAVEREPAPLPLGGLFFLARGGEQPGPAVRALARADFRLLLASTFNETIQSPERLRRQFELCAELAERVPMWRVAVQPGVSAAALARTLRTQAEAAT